MPGCRLATRRAARESETYLWPQERQRQFAAPVDVAESTTTLKCFGSPQSAAMKCLALQRAQKIWRTGVDRPILVSPQLSSVKIPIYKSASDLLESRHVQAVPLRRTANGHVPLNAIGGVAVFHFSSSNFSRASISVQQTRWHEPK